MKKYLLIILGLAFIGAISQTDVKINKLFSSFEAQVRKHLKTKKITCNGDVQSETFTYKTAKTEYYSIPACAFAPVSTSSDTWRLANATLLMVTSLNIHAFGAPVFLPNGAVVTVVTSYWYRDDSSAAGVSSLERADFEGGSISMAHTNSDATSGYHSVTDSTVGDATIDNTTYNYYIYFTIDPNDDVEDVRYAGCKITYTTSEP